MRPARSLIRRRSRGEPLMRSAYRLDAPSAKGIKVTPNTKLAASPSYGGLTLFGRDGTLWLLAEKPPPGSGPHDLARSVFLIDAVILGCQSGDAEDERLQVDAAVAVGLHGNGQAAVQEVRDMGPVARPEPAVAE